MTAVLVILGLGAVAVLCGTVALASYALRPNRRERREPLYLGLVLLVVGGSIIGVTCTTDPTKVVDATLLSQDFGAFQAASLSALLAAFIFTCAWYRGDPSRGRRRCPKCWYDMSGSGAQCPECGRVTNKERRFFRTRRRNPVILTACALSVTSYGLWITPHVKRGGPVAAIPSVVLIAGMPWFGESLIIDSSDGTSFHNYSLRGRLNDNRLWRWQVSLAHWRARQMILSECSIPNLHKAMPFVRDTDADLVLPWTMIVVRGLADPNPATRSAAASAPRGYLFELDDVPLGARVHPFKDGLAGALSDPVKQVRGLAAWYLVELGVEADEFVPQMLRNLKGPSDNTIAIHLGGLTDDAIRRQAEVSATARELMFEASRSPDPSLRARIALCMESRELAALGATDRLIEMTRDSSDNVATNAAFSLFRGSRHSAEAAAAILNLIEAKKLGVACIGDWLPAFGEHITPLLPRLVHLLSAGTAEEQREVLRFFDSRSGDVRIDLTTAVEPLRGIVRSGQTYERELAQQILDRIANRKPGAPSPH